MLWDSAGSGKLSARLRHLTLDSANEASRAGARDAVDKLPALDVVADEFAIGARRFGRLELQARNDAGNWQLTTGNLKLHSPRHFL